MNIISRLFGAIFKNKTQGTESGAFSQEDAAASRKTRLYIGNLSYNATQQDLEKLFSGHGQPRGVHIVRDRFTHKLKGYAFVEMSNPDEAQRALQLSGTEFLGRKIVVSMAKSKKMGTGHGIEPGRRARRP